MATSHEPDITQLLRASSQGNRSAVDHLMSVVYEELRRIAHGQLSRERTGHTFCTTALVHEAYLRLVKLERVEWRDRAHFFAIAARMMRRILIDYARARSREKREGSLQRVPLTEGVWVEAGRTELLLELEDALLRLEAQNSRQCRVVECRCFAGLSVDETAAALGTSAATVKRDWAFARAWLNRELATNGEHDRAPT